MNDELDDVIEAFWTAGAADVTYLLANMDTSVEMAGGSIPLAAARLAKSFDDLAPGRTWLACRLAVALHMMNAATGPISEHLAQQVADKLKEQL